MASVSPARPLRRVLLAGVPAVLAAVLSATAAPAAHAADYSGYTLNQLRQDCLAHGQVVSPYSSPGAPWYVPSTQVAYGSQGVCVALAQELIGAKVTDCVPSGGLAVDGDDGPLTTAAVTCVQSRANLTRDGIVGPYTWSVLWFVD